MPSLDQEIAKVGDVVGVLINEHEIGTNLEALRARSLQRRIRPIDRA